MNSVAVITSDGRPVEGIPGEVAIVLLPGASELVSVMAHYDAAVLVSDRFTADEIAQIAGAIATLGKPVIEVRSTRWDGESPSPLSAACRGVIAGFGDAGAAAAVRLLQTQAW